MMYRQKESLGRVKLVEVCESAEDSLREAKKIECAAGGQDNRYIDRRRGIGAGKKRFWVETKI